MADDVRAMHRRAVAEGALDRIVVEPARLDQMQPPAGWQRTERERLFEPAIHRHRMRLAVKAEPPEKQHGDVLRRDAEPLPPTLAQRRRWHVGVAIDPERNDRQLRQAA